MSKVYVISDLHLSHLNMALHRGFSSIESHDNYIIEQWNGVINKRDTVWILGDITMEKSTPYPILSKLNGIKKIVLGNHDKPSHSKELLKYANVVCGMTRYKNFILTHCPIHESQLIKVYGNIHGHLHENSLNDPRYINVSCEVVGYTPVLIDAITSSCQQKKFVFPSKWQIEL